MKPEQFIREFGVEKAREVVEGAPSSATTARPSLDFKHYLYGRCENAGGSHILLSDLKRLVESVEIIQFWHGIEWCKGLVEDYKEEPIHKESYGHRIIQAIADYESIYGGGE
ncbi:hypothetical protein ABTP83_07120 [Acinetobacter baumannii]